MVLRNNTANLGTKTLLDVGCGDGRFCYEMKNEKIKITGLDYSKKAIQFAKAFNPKILFINKDLIEYETNKKFDYIILIETLEHIKPELLDKFIKKIGDLSKKDGYLIITVSSVNLPLDKKHYQHFDKEKLEKILKNYYKVEKIIGHYKIGYKRKILRLINLFFSISKFIFKNRSITKHIFAFEEKYFKKYLEICKPEEGTRIIACLTKKI